MDQRFRSLFNEQFTPELYAWYQRELSSRLNTTFEFRLAESPVFLTDDFWIKNRTRAIERVNRRVNTNFGQCTVQRNG